MSSSIKTLEDAIKLAKLTVKSDVDQLVIDRTRFASRKRNRLSTISIAKDQIAHNTIRKWKRLLMFLLYIIIHKQIDKDDPSDLSQEIQFWKEKYEKLFEDQSNNENQHQDELDHSLKRYNNLEDYVALLEEKVEDLGKKVENKSNSRNDDNSLLSFYERMTSMTVKKEKKKDVIYNCSLKNEINRRVIQFNIKFETFKDKNDIIFEPKVNGHNLPEYLRGGITGEAIMAPVIMGDILQMLYEDKETDN